MGRVSKGTIKRAKGKKIPSSERVDIIIDDPYAPKSGESDEDKANRLRRINLGKWIKYRIHNVR